MNNVLEISSRKFRERQKEFFELVDKGTRLVIKRGENKAYILTPVDIDELYLSPALQREIDQALQDIKDGKGKKYSAEEIDKLLGI